MAKTATKANITDILDRQASEIERPKPLPAGSYLCVVKGQPRHDKSAKKQTPFVEFTLGFLQAYDDVDENELKTSLTKADGETVALTDKTMKATFYLTEGSAFMLTDFLTACGLDTDADASVRQLLEETPGCQVTATVKHEASQDGTSIYAKFGNFAKAE